MPADRTVQERRRQAILEILRSNEQVGQQRELVQLLNERGIPATQSSVSRDLGEIGAIRLGEKWVLPDWLGTPSPIEKVADYILEARSAGPHQTLMTTTPGAGPIVAKAVDDSAYEYVVGTVAGFNSVLILTSTLFDQKMLFARFKHDLHREVEEKIIRRGAGGGAGEDAG